LDATVTDALPVAHDPDGAQCAVADEPAEIP
jgi:hypothetical protein